MRAELERSLIEKYPSLFKDRDRPLTDSLMCFGCECGDGWFNLLDRTCAKLFKACSPSYRLMQVKEKYGALRIYGLSDNDETLNICDRAEEESRTICEICGKPGKIIGGAWLVCRCEEHEQEERQ